MPDRFTAASLVALFLLAASAAAETETPISATQCAAMKAHHVLNAGAPIACDRLAAVRFSYVGFDGRAYDNGVVVVLDAVAPYVERIFAALYARRFPVAKAQPMETFDGDDARAMEADNTSAFNHRAIQGSERLSLHAYGAAIDLNPVENPYLARTGTAITVTPARAVAYLNRNEDRPNKPARAGLAESVVDVFADNGFLNWGGDWDDPIDYQHFDIGRALAERLAALPPDQARDAFASVVHAYQDCVAKNSDKIPGKRRQICTAARSY
jgi:hypothetical protein